MRRRRARPNPRKLRAVAAIRAGNQESPLAKPNYSFEKRQRELAKKKKQEQKQEQKRLQKLAKTTGDTTTPAPDDAATGGGSGDAD